MKPRRVVSLATAVALGSAALVAAAPAGAGAAVAATTSGSRAAAQPTAPRRSGSKYWICLPGTDAPRPNLHYPFTFLLSTRFAHTKNRHIRTSVREIQIMLNTEHAAGAQGPLKVDGLYGPRTKRAVKRFQRHRHLTVDGKVGPRTWKKLTRNCWMFH